MPLLEQRSYPEIVKDLEAFKTYLAEAVGLPAPRRLRKIIANINELERMRRDNRLQDLISPANNRAREMVWSIVEGQQLTTIFAGLQGYNPSVLKPLLSKALKGPLDPTDEDSSKSTNKARNILFELLLGAQFRRANFDVKLGGEADLQFDHAGARLYIECKRPFVGTTIRENVSKARQQLQQRFKKDVRDSGMGGLVAISVSKALNEGHNMLTVDDEDGLKQLVAT